MPNGWPDPGRFMGAGKKPPYFEGWYYRVVAPDGRAFCFIPGICLGGEDSHCFLQVLGPAGPRYLRYPVSAFSYAKGSALFRVGGSAFGADGFRVESEANGRIAAAVNFTSPVPYPGGPLHSGIMGPFALVPGLPCRHAVLCVRSGLSGFVELGGERVELSGGVGYIEKDWGSSFPDAYLWAQCGRFEEEADAALFLSAALVPFAGRELRGLIAFLYRGGRFTRFTTYAGARLASIRHGEPGGAVSALLRGPALGPGAGLTLSLRFVPGAGFALAAPGPGGMRRKVVESAAETEAVLRRGAGGRVLFCGRGTGAVETYGDLTRLCPPCGAEKAP